MLWSLTLNSSLLTPYLLNLFYFKWIKVCKWIKVFMAFLLRLLSRLMMWLPSDLHSNFSFQAPSPLITLARTNVPFNQLPQETATIIWVVQNQQISIFLNSRCQIFTKAYLWTIVVWRLAGMLVILLQWSSHPSNSSIHPKAQQHAHTQIKQFY